MLYKYTPAANEEASNETEYLPAVLISLTKVFTSSPSTLNIFNVTLLSLGIENEIIVDGLNGFG